MRRGGVANTKKDGRNATSLLTTRTTGSRGAHKRLSHKEGAVRCLTTLAVAPASLCSGIAICALTRPRWPDRPTSSAWEAARSRAARRRSCSAGAPRSSGSRRCRSRSGDLLRRCSFYRRIKCIVLKTIHQTLLWLRVPQLTRVHCSFAAAVHAQVVLRAFAMERCLAAGAGAVRAVDGGTIVAARRVAAAAARAATNRLAAVGPDAARRWLWLVPHAGSLLLLPVRARTVSARADVTVQRCRLGSAARRARERGPSARPSHVPSRVAPV